MCSCVYTSVVVVEKSATSLSVCASAEEEVVVCVGCCRSMRRYLKCPAPVGIYFCTYEVREENTRRNKGSLRSLPNHLENTTKRKRVALYTSMVCGAHCSVDKQTELITTPSRTESVKISSRHATPRISESRLVPRGNWSFIQQNISCGRHKAACMIANDSYTNNPESRSCPAAAPRSHRHKCANTCGTTTTRTSSLLKPNRRSVTPTSKLKKYRKKLVNIFSIIRVEEETLSRCLTSIEKSPISFIGIRCRSSWPR